MRAKSLAKAQSRKETRTLATLRLCAKIKIVLLKISRMTWLLSHCPSPLRHCEPKGGVLKWREAICFIEAVQQHKGVPCSLQIASLFRTSPNFRQ